MSNNIYHCNEFNLLQKMRRGKIESNELVRCQTSYISLRKTITTLWCSLNITQYCVVWQKIVRHLCGKSNGTSLF